MRGARQFFTRWENYLGLLLVLAFLAVAAAAPVLSPRDPTDEGLFKRAGRASDFTPRPPSGNARLGTLPGQIDIYHALVWGTRSAVQFGLLVAGFSLVIGVLVGSVAGYAGGLLNNFLMRVADSFLTFPVLAGVFFLNQIITVAVRSKEGFFYPTADNLARTVYFFREPDAFTLFLTTLDPVMITLVLFSWMPIARIVNTMVLTLKNMEFVHAARALGGRPAWILRRHLIPNAIGPAIVLATRDVGSSVIMQATITFIGLGGGSPWGEILSIGRNWVIGPGANLLFSWWIYVPATVVVLLFGIGWNLLGDGLQHALDPYRHQ